MNQHVAHLLKRFRAVYGEPKSEEPDVLMSEYTRALRTFSASAIERAGNVLIDGLRDDGKPRRFWPTVSECREACIAAREALAAEVRRYEPRPPPEPERQPLTPEERERHAALMAELRKHMAGNILEKAPETPVEWMRGTRPVFEDMQERSRNPIHRRGL